MSIVTKDPHTWFVATNDKGKKQIVYNNERYEHNYPVAFEANFSDTPTPPVNTVTMYNMSKEHRDFYKKGQKVYLAFNWGTSKKIISQGYISKMQGNSSDGTTETFQLTFTEGTDYTNVAASKMKVSKKKTTKSKKGKTKTKTVQVNKTFRVGTSTKSVIQGIAKQSGIKIAKIQLAKNPKMKKAYTAKGKPLTLLKSLVKTTGSKMTYVRGNLEIVNPKDTKRTWYEIDDKDLITPPTFNSEDDDSSKGNWEITIPLVPEITVNVGIKMNSRYLKGKFYVKAGQHTSDGENPETQCTLVTI
ncbi:hypothetical protein [Lactobacillus sp.]|uniref:hypothetical protein n=1 Tax=Lactobacillus sp. TaxID=1591 RepID=UPI00198F02F4|nr:hypothetical protein [Lactobacillus sp.]MBD5430148.1 hypothetical protein [Lactobacillus sp.]